MKLLPRYYCQCNIQYSLHRHALGNFDASPDFMNALSVHIAHDLLETTMMLGILKFVGLVLSDSLERYFSYSNWLVRYKLLPGLLTEAVYCCLTFVEELPSSPICVASASCCNSGMLGRLYARQSHHIAHPRYTVGKVKLRTFVLPLRSPN
ncbi:hypothetical protein TSUD_291330 [Trifolium subterraneum]|uniref:Uncharacterized protein n=1 Tax=Trifolium subterraneum TaxID=3900 RepID=A0A2Z6PHR9_TRISU|nr:hypothetical protein TSUD_291330 [Trifolium subterraneum]